MFSGWSVMISSTISATTRIGLRFFIESYKYPFFLNVIYDAYPYLEKRSGGLQTLCSNSSIRAWLKIHTSVQAFILFLLKYIRHCALFVESVFSYRVVIANVAHS